jgi:CDP-diacylglycerol--glycerol-3-phosphate 3-phosphatidyltransferase/cardiolipin synthase
MIPNLISLSRLVLAVLFVLFVDRPAIAVAILCAAGISDWLDGWVAGKLGQRTRLGALLDPICDRLFVVPVLVTVVVTYGVPLWQLGVIIARDVANSFGSLLVWLLRPHRMAGLLPRRSGSW